MSSEIPSIYKQFHEIIKVGLLKWLIDNRYEIKGGLWLDGQCLSLIIGVYHALDNPINTPYGFTDSSNVYKRKQKLDETIQRHKMNGYISKTLYNKWEEIRAEEWNKEEEEEEKRQDEIRRREKDKEDYINGMINDLTGRIIALIADKTTNK